VLDALLWTSTFWSQSQVPAPACERLGREDFIRRSTRTCSPHAMIKSAVACHDRRGWACCLITSHIVRAPIGVLGLSKPLPYRSDGYVAVPSVMSGKGVTINNLLPGFTPPTRGMRWMGGRQTKGTPEEPAPSGINNSRRALRQRHESGPACSFCAQTHAAFNCGQNLLLEVARQT